MIFTEYRILPKLAISISHRSDKGTWFCILPQFLYDLKINCCLIRPLLALAQGGFRYAIHLSVWKKKFEVFHTFFLTLADIELFFF